ncbi:MAG: hypothetical protein HUU02_06885 [Bacteroidetes bacterium]|nr:hypothetical protein [Bacteroidota bacterium]
MPNDPSAYHAGRLNTVRSAFLTREWLIRPFTILSLSVLSFILASCTPPAAEPRYSPPPKRTVSSPAPERPALPEGWADITARSKQPQIKLWLINRDYSGTMVLREFQGDASALRPLLSDEMMLAASLSLRSKVPENDPDFRVTRVPAVIDRKRNLISYAYSEKGLLRRVVVFRSMGKLMELELMQEQAAAEFDLLTNDLVTFAARWYDRRVP